MRFATKVNAAVFAATVIIAVADKSSNRDGGILSLRTRSTVANAGTDTSRTNATKGARLEDGSPFNGSDRRSLVVDDCPTHKKVTMYKFCIEGDCDAGSYGEHMLKLDGDWLYDGYRDYLEGQCHNISAPSRVVEAWKSLTVGTEEHDTTSENDSYFATMTAEEWYSPTCATYEIELAVPHQYEAQHTLCWSASVGTELGALFEYETCDQWTAPAESFVWKLKVEPADPPPPVPASCKPEKKITMYKFCIEGDCDSGAQGEHRLRLDGHWLYNGFRDYREGQCHSLDLGSKTIEAWKSLTVATEEHDNWPNSNDHYTATLENDKWYNPTCAPYEIRVAQEHTGAKTVTSCWNLSLAAMVNGVSLGAGVSSCSEWEEPAQSFIWMLQVEAVQEQEEEEQEEAACMSGETGVTLVAPKAIVHSEKSNLRSITDGKDQIVTVKDLKAGDSIRGLDENRDPAICTVEAVGLFGSGPVYGNYTHGHYILNPNSGDVEVHGTDQAMSIQEKYDVLTSCPLGMDETGTAFTALDTDFCGGFAQDMSWSDYLLLHKAILRMVRGTGGYWFHGSSYEDLGFLKTHAPTVCATMLRCIKDHNDCLEFEDASVVFIENTLSDSAKEKAYDSFHNIGRHRELGSAAAMVSAGGSVRK